MPTLTAHKLKLEPYQEDECGPWVQMTCKFVKRFLFFEKQTNKQKVNKIGKKNHIKEDDWGIYHMRGDISSPRKLLKLKAWSTGGSMGRLSQGTTMPEQRQFWALSCWRRDIGSVARMLSLPLLGGSPEQNRPRQRLWLVLKPATEISAQHGSHSLSSVGEHAEKGEDAN